MPVPLLVALVGTAGALVGSAVGALLTYRLSEHSLRARELREDERKQRAAKAERLRRAFHPLLRIALDYALAARQAEVLQARGSPEQKAAALRNLARPASDDRLRNVQIDLELEVGQQEIGELLQSFLHAHTTYQAGVAAAASGGDPPADFWAEIEQDGQRMQELAEKLAAAAREQLDRLERPS